MANLATMPTTWAALTSKVGTGSDVRIGHNTTATYAPSGNEPAYVIALHGHSIVRVFASKVAVRHCGWVSVTTFDRIRRFLPAGWSAGFAGGDPHVRNYRTGERHAVDSSEWVAVRGD